MDTTQRMIKQGNWLFRYRSWLPLILIVFAIFSMIINPYRQAFTNIWYLLFCIAVAAAGQIIRIISVGYAADGTSGRNTKRQVADEINQTGIYSILRNPLYLGNLLMWLGAALYTRIWWLVLAFFIIFWLYYERIILAEEDYLLDKFGAGYIAYTEKVNCMVPSLNNYQPNRYTFRIKKALRQEYSGIYALFLVFTALELLRNFLMLHKIYLSAMWIAAGCVLTLSYLTMRLLKKRTHYLDKELECKKLNYEE
ncbi:MAG: isoprenylcysteine carboxylmethyltransferase family protein [Candidatus Cloacimonadaceae bacterium]